MFDPEQLHDPEFRTRVQAARTLIAERVRRGVATPAEHLAWAPSAAFREAVRSAALATLALYVGIVETLADEADRDDGETMH